PLNSNEQAQRPVPPGAGRPARRPGRPRLPQRAVPPADRGDELLPLLGAGLLDRQGQGASAPRADSPAGPHRPETTSIRMKTIQEQVHAEPEANLTVSRGHGAPF